MKLKNRIPLNIIGTHLYSANDLLKYDRMIIKKLKRITMSRVAKIRWHLFKKLLNEY